MSAKNRSETGPSGKGGATVVLVDDNDDVREVTALLLSKLGYNVIGAESGAKALSLLETGTTADLLIADFSMPDMSGIELSEKVRSGWPAVKVLFVTGYADIPGFQDQLSGETVVKKPFTIKQLESALAGALNASGDHPRVPAGGRKD
jgi:CheY-like chemotaxis protein